MKQIIVKFKNNKEGFNFNSFEELLKIDNYNDITYLDCRNNSLYILPALPSSLTYFCCRNNFLTSLPNLPSSLTHFCCRINNLTSLPTLPSSLEYLDCDENSLTTLPTLPSSLCNLKCYCSPIYYIYIENYFEKDWKKYREYQHSILKKFANKIGSWFLECKYNPKYKYCQRRLSKEYKELFDEV